MFRSADPGNEIVHEEPDNPLGPTTRGCTQLHEENEHWWLAEENKGQVVYVPVAHPMNIVDERQSRKWELIAPLYLSNR